MVRLLVPVARPTKDFVDPVRLTSYFGPMSLTVHNVGVLMGVLGGVCLACTRESGAGPARTALLNTTPTLRVAISIDDLPWNGKPPSGESPGAALQRIGAALQRFRAPATGFVICDAAQEDRAAIDGWIRSGFDLGNHSARHRDLNKTPLGEWLDDVRRCDAQLLGHGSAYTHYFRFPYLHQGLDLATRSAVAQALGELGSSTAHVSVDTSEWILAEGYARAFQRTDTAAMDALGVDLIRHVRAALAHADDVARHKLGRRIPLVLLLHANLLVADKLQDLLETLSAHDVEFISVRQALADPGYALPDEYVGPKGMSWLYRIAPLEMADVAWDDREEEAVTAFVARLLP
jgi:peptidoglycan-N-acetylglucosamine deacetylase